ATHEVKWFWVKGHSGDPGNEMADQLANLGVDSVIRKDSIGKVHVIDGVEG
ncbi:RNase H family protein, partial [Oleiphilus sp. HI0117]